MDSKQYLTEKRYQKFNKAFKILYLVLLLIGIGMFIGGIILLVSNKSVSYFSIEKLIGWGLIVVGISLTILSVSDLYRYTFTRDIISYHAQQQMSKVKEDQMKCKHCSKLIDKDSIYCEFCGKEV